MPQSAKKAPGKREARKIDRREAIVEVAKRQFLDNGYAATSMSAIAAELRGSKATLWSYFPNKEDLFAAVLDEATAAYRQQFADLLRPSKDMPSAVLQFTRSFMAKLTLPEPLRLHRLIVAESGRNPELGQLFFERAPGPTLAMLRDFMADGMASGQLRQADPQLAADALTSLCLGGMHRRILWGAPPPAPAAVETEARNVTDIFMAAFGPRP